MIVEYRNVITSEIRLGRDWPVVPAGTCLYWEPTFPDVVFAFVHGKRLEFPNPFVVSEADAPIIVEPPQ